MAPSRPKPPGRKRAPAAKKQTKKGAGTETTNEPTSTSTAVEVVDQNPGVEYGSFTHFTRTGLPEKASTRMGHFMSWFGVFFWVFVCALIVATVWYYFAVAIPRRGGEIPWVPDMPTFPAKTDPAETTPPPPPPAPFITDENKETLKKLVQALVGIVVAVVVVLLVALLVFFLSFLKGKNEEDEEDKDGKDKDEEDEEDEDEEEADLVKGDPKSKIINRVQHLLVDFVPPKSFTMKFFDPKKGKMKKIKFKKGETYGYYVKEMTKSKSLLEILQNIKTFNPINPSDTKIVQDMMKKRTGKLLQDTINDLQTEWSNGVKRKNPDMVSLEDARLIT